MAHLVDELKAKADADIAAMRSAALRARDTHARAELMRHMLMTANTVKGRPAADAVRFIVDHWLEAWALTRASWPHVTEMEALPPPFTPTRSRPATRTTTPCVDVHPARARLRRGRDADRRPDGMAARSARTAGGRGAPGAAGTRTHGLHVARRPFWEQGCRPECL